MDFALNPGLDAKTLASEYAKRARLQVRNIFPEDLAERTFRALSSETPWGLFYKGPEKGVRIPPAEFKTMSQEKQQEIYRHIFQTARNQYQFMYLFNNLSDKNRQGDLFLHKVADFLTSEPVLEFVRVLTGIAELKSADAQATRYIGNCFLHPHTDEGSETGRRVAYVLNMTKGWDPNWGGYLQFFDENMNIVESYKPTFNAINLFTVPQGHAVGYVPPFCPGERLSITGWFRDQ